MEGSTCDQTITEFVEFIQHTARESPKLGKEVRKAAFDKPGEAIAAGFDEACRDSAQASMHWPGDLPIQKIAACAPM
jgi:hypothetical protein